MRPLEAATFACAIALPALSRFMNPKIICLFVVGSLALTAPLFAAGGKTYEMTGTVASATGTTLAVEKGT